MSLFNSSKYEESIREFDLSLNSEPLVGDYALFFKARAYKELNRNELAREALNKLFTSYPASTLLKRAKYLEISIAPEESALRLMKEYLERYPDDEAVRLKLGLLLKQMGKIEEADRIFSRLYIESGWTSAEAIKNMTRPLRAAEFLARAENLLKAARFKDAESELASAYVADDGSSKDKITSLGAKLLFMQKRYKESAEKYLETSNLLEAARAYYRNGDEPQLKMLLEILISTGDEKVAGLLGAYAAKKRRNREIAEAIKILETAKDKFPRKKEEILWELAWLYYLKRDYALAFSNFSELEYENPKSAYKYWKARAMERLGANSAEIYSQLSSGAGYYGVMSRFRTGAAAPFNISSDYKAAGKSRFTRIDILLDAGLKDEAIEELLIKAEKSFESGTVIAISMKLKEIGAYKQAMHVAAKLPEELQPKEILYPAAFWQEVEKASERNGIDPYLVLSVMREESRFEPQACSPVGALGLMQLMPETAEKLAKLISISVGGAESIYRVENNISMGSFYLKKLLLEFGSIPAALAAYNAGESAVRSWLEAGQYESEDEFIEDIPYSETKNYVKRIINTYFIYRGAEAVLKELAPRKSAGQKPVLKKQS